MFLLRKLGRAGVFSALGILFSLNVHAQKILGADIWYKYLGHDSMEVFIDAYLRCDGKTATSTFKPGDITVTPKTSSAFTSKLTYVADTDVTPVSKGYCSPCSDTGCTFKKGVIRYRYSAVFSLGSLSDCFFTFGWQHAGREINGKGIYVEATYERCKTGPHSSPTFNENPVTVLCKNNAVFHNLNKLFDTVSNYTFYLAKSRATKDTFYSYPSGYDYDRPLTYSGFPTTYGEWQYDAPNWPGFHLLQDGTLWFRPTKVESAVIAMGILQTGYDSLKNGYTVGTISRDIQYDIIDCGSNNSPIVTGIECTRITTETFCANGKKCFTICSYDADSSSDTVSLKWIKPVANATFTVDTGKTWPKAQICWQPDDAYVRDYPYTFMVEGTDSKSHISNKVQKIFTIYVKANPKGFIKTTYDKCGWVTLEAVVTNNIGVKEYRWDGQYSQRDYIINVRGGKIKVKYKPDPAKAITKYPITLTITSIPGCETSITDTVTLNNYTYADLGPDTTVCVNAPLKLKAKQYFGKPTFNYSWYVYNPTTKTYDLKVNKVWGRDSFAITANENKIVVIQVYDSTSCDNTDTLRIFAHIPPAPYLGPDRRGCLGTPVVLNATKSATGKKIPSTRSIEWFKSDNLGNYSSLGKDSIWMVKDSGTYRVVVTDSTGCSGVDEINVYFNPLVDVVRGTYTICKGETAHLSGGAGGFGTVWKWYTADDTLSNPVAINTTQTYNFIPPSGTRLREWKFRVKAEQTLMGVTCADEDTITLILDTTCIRPCTSRLYSTDTTICRDDTISLHAAGGTGYLWFPSTGVSNITSPDPEIFTLTSRKYSLVINDSVKKCADTFSVMITVDQHCSRYCSTRLHSGDTTICRGDSVTLHASGGTKYHWFPSTGVSDTTSANPIVYTQTSRTYYVSITDSVHNCLDTFSLTVTVDTACVWPGDANYDKVADYKDILAIGVGYGRTGYSRNANSTDWKKVPSKDWSLKTSAGINYKHMDCDGNGAIQAKDTVAVSLNYGKTHKKQGGPQLAGANDPVITIRFAKDTFYAGDTVRAVVLAGTLQNPLVNAYGIGLDFDAGSTFIKSSTLKYSFECNKFCNTDSVLTLVRKSGTQIQGALVRTNHKGVNGADKVGNAMFILKDTLAYNYGTAAHKLSLSLNDLMLVDTTGNILPVNIDNGEAVVLKKRSKTVGVAEDIAARKIRIYPNPATESFTIETGGLKVSSISLINVMGQEVKRAERPASGQCQIDVSNYKPGIYFIRVNTWQGVITQKLIIQ